MLEGRYLTVASKVPVQFDLDDLAFRLDQFADHADSVESETITIDRVTWVMARSLVDAHRYLLEEGSD